jgi:hypothetical protein
MSTLLELVEQYGDLRVEIAEHDLPDDRASALLDVIEWRIEAIRDAAVDFAGDRVQEILDGEE